MVEGQPPSYNPANAGSLAGVMREVMRKFLMSTDDMLPAKVVAYDRATNLAQVEPMVMVLTTENKTVKRAQIASVPVFAMGGGGYVINFPIKPDDTGWIKANDRDISLYMRALSEAGPNTLRLHSFADGLFIPDVVRNFVIAAEDADAMVIQSLSGSVKIALHPDSVTILAPAGVKVDTPITTMTGDLQVNGTIHADVDVVADNISLKTHPHGSVQPGSGTSGGPLP